MSNLQFNSGIARLGIVLFAAAAANVSVTGDAAAKHLKRVAHHRKWLAHVQNAQASVLEPSHLGTMRYYGGPKAPMWRVVE
jgi:hypothetical protein